MLCCAAAWVDPDVLKALGSLKTSGTAHPTIEQNMPDDLDLLLSFCRNMCCRPHSEVTALNKSGAIWEWMVFQTQKKKLGECNEQRKVIQSHWSLNMKNVQNYRKKTKNYRTTGLQDRKIKPLHSLQQINSSVCSIQIASAELKEMSPKPHSFPVNSSCNDFKPRAIYRLRLLYVHNWSNEND